MKKSIYISGIILVNLMLTGALLKALHLPGANVLLFISILFFSFGFLPVALISSYGSQEEKNNKWLFIVTFLVFSINLIGALFKILHWPYAGIIMVIGIPLPYVLFLPVYLYHTHKNKNKSVMNNLGIMFGLTFLAVFSVLLTLNVGLNVIDNFAFNSYNNEKTSMFYRATAESPLLKNEIKQKADALYTYVEQLKCEILTSNGNSYCSEGKLHNDFDPLYLTQLENSSTQVSFLYDGKPSKIDILKDKIIEFKVIISTSNHNSKELMELSNSLFEIESKEIQKNGKTIIQNWVENEFPSAHLALFLEVLTRIQSNVRFIESELAVSL